MKLVSTLIVALLVSSPAFAQYWTLPEKGTEVTCTGCGFEFNAPNAEGKPTPGYDDPVARFTGRVIDSVNVTDFQGYVRTLRARFVRRAPHRDRIYFAHGSLIGAYTESTFFTTTLRRTLSDVRVFGNVQRGTYPYEKVAAPDAFFYAERSGSGWATPMYDGQIRLNDFDVDDRGYLYIASGFTFGWGIEYDGGATDGSHLQFVYQDQDPPAEPKVMVAFRSGDSYYAAYGPDASQVSDMYSDKLRIYDVTTPAAPLLKAARRDHVTGIRFWTRDPVSGRIAVVSHDAHLRVYDPAALAAATTNSVIPTVVDRTPASGQKFGALAFDSTGSLWVAEGATSPAPGASLLRFVPEGVGYSVSSTSLGTIAPHGVDAAGGFVTVTGRVSVDGSSTHDLKLYRIVDGAPVLLDTATFFQKYYHATAAQPYARYGARMLPQSVRLVEEASKTYLIYNAYGLGDVYELQRGDAERLATSTTLDVMPHPSADNEPVTLTATVSAVTPGATLPSGAVTFTMAGTPLTTASLESDGAFLRATAITTKLGEYPAAIIATYEGDDHYEGSVSPAVDHQPDVLVAPKGFTAALNGSAISLSWSRIPGINRYQILRREGASFEIAVDQTFGETSTLTYLDPVTSPGSVHVYRVRGVMPSGEPGLETGTEAVLSTTFTDPGRLWHLPIKAIHVTELRAAVNAYRAAVGLSARTFTDPDLGVSRRIRVIHLTELRDGLNDARVAVGLYPTSLPFAAQGAVITEWDIEHLRSAVR